MKTPSLDEIYCSIQDMRYSRKEPVLIIASKMLELELIMSNIGLVASIPKETGNVLFGVNIIFCYGCDTFEVI